MECKFGRAVLGASTLMLLLNCNGNIFSPVPTQVEKKEPTIPRAECLPGPPVPGASPLRRLTKVEYENTVADLLGDTSQPSLRFPAEEIGLGFTNNADVQTVSDVLIERYETEAIRLAAAFTQDLPGLLGGCDLSAEKQDGCVKDFITSFGRRVYRRALAADEVNRLQGFYLAAKATDDFPTAVRLTVQAMLQSPSFLYRVEFGDGAVGTSRVTGYELASRLSYLLWSSAPDTALLDAAANGQLDTAPGLAAEAQRLLNERARSDRSLKEFFGQWLHLDGVGVVEKQPQLFPAFTDEIRGLLRKETELFTISVVKSGNLKDLFAADYTFLNQPLAKFYGVSGPTGSAFERVTHEPGRRAGLLTQGSLLSAHAKANQTSPVARGFFVLDSILCMPPKPPPQGAQIRVPELDPTLSTRERFERHRTDNYCASCHYQMDPIGFAFENYDAAGVWRTDENGITINASGALINTDIDGSFKNAIELSQKLATSAQAQACVVRNWFRFSYGRGDGNADACALQSLDDILNHTGGNLNELITGLTQTDMFRYRTNEEVPP
ncbi:MAG: DUF1592 domain-containing protein [Myxococcaceae bacterium]|nr:DUF1592 domain-containing protein [Myxococcaceae bacterium]